MVNTVKIKSWDGKETLKIIIIIILLLLLVRESHMDRKQSTKLT